MRGYHPTILTCDVIRKCVFNMSHIEGSDDTIAKTSVLILISFGRCRGHVYMIVLEMVMQMQLYIHWIFGHRGYRNQLN